MDLYLCNRRRRRCRYMGIMGNVRSECSLPSPGVMNGYGVSLG